MNHQRPSFSKPHAPCRIGINGFGRIGRNVLRASLLREDVLVVAINHTCASIDDLLHLIRYDSTHGPLSSLSPAHLTVLALPNGNIIINGHEIEVFSERNLEKLDWAVHGAEYVAECTGKFRKVEQASKHITFGKAKKVLISAPSPDAPTFVYKVNMENYLKPGMGNVFSCASCTTNCLAPIAKVVNDKFGIVQAFMTTVHASTQSQHVLDGYSSKDRRSGRSVIGNIIPTTTGASKAISLVLPELSGKVAGISIRVPTTNVSMVDLDVHTSKATSLLEVLGAFREASETYLAGVLSVEDEELVSCDFLSRPSSAIIDVKASIELNSNFFKIVAWYDNEWAYSCRLLDMLSFMSKVDQEAEVRSIRQELVTSREIERRATKAPTVAVMPTVQPFEVAAA